MPDRLSLLPTSPEALPLGCPSQHSFQVRRTTWPIPCRKIATCKVRLLPCTMHTARTSRIQVLAMLSQRTQSSSCKIKEYSSSVANSLLPLPSVQLSAISSSLGISGSMAVLVQPEPGSSDLKDPRTKKTRSPRLLK